MVRTDSDSRTDYHKEAKEINEIEQKKSSVLVDRFAKAEAKKRKTFHHVTRGTVRYVP